MFAIQGDAVAATEAGSVVRDLCSAQHLAAAENRSTSSSAYFRPACLFCFLNSILPRRVRRVAVVHDLQGVLAAQESGLVRRAIIHMIHAVESRVFRSQDLCIFFSEDMARIAQQSYGLDPAKIAVQYPSITLPASYSAIASVLRRRIISIAVPARKIACCLFRRARLQAEFAAAGRLDAGGGGTPS